eukprot:2121835-Amphidinium_carterae.1
MSTVTSFAIHTNSFEGGLPGSGLQVMRAVSRFYIARNGFKGTIPESGIRRMSAVTEFGIFTNSFEGALSECGLEVMQTMSILYVQENRFAGTVPNRAVARLRALSVSNNDFEGRMCHTLITESTGDLPRPQLAGRANSTALTWRQRTELKMRGSHSLSLRMSQI